jgi:hypothetical protein
MVKNFKYSFKDHIVNKRDRKKFLNLPASDLIVQSINSQKQVQPVGLQLI